MFIRITFVFTNVIRYTEQYICAEDLTRSRREWFWLAGERLLEGACRYTYGESLGVNEQGELPCPRDIILLATALPCGFYQSLRPFRLQRADLPWRRYATLSALQKAVSSRFCTPWPIQITLVMTRLPVGIRLGLRRICWARHSIVRVGDCPLLKQPCERLSHRAERPVSSVCSTTVVSSIFRALIPPSTSVFHRKSVRPFLRTARR